jgi:hypothetical protein
MPRTLDLVYQISPAQTGSLNFTWDSLDGSFFNGTLNYYGTDSTRASIVASRNMRNTTSYNVSISSATHLYLRAIIDKDKTPPTFSGVSHNSTIAGHATRFSILFNDTFALNSTGAYIFSTNNSGSWVNDSRVFFTTTPSWANVTKTLTASSGASVGYRWYANDTAGNWNVTPIYSFVTTGGVSDSVAPTLNFVSPTPANSATTSNSSIRVNTSIVEQNLKELKWNWNGTNTTLYNDSLVLFMNFDNRSALGENNTRVVDLSRGENNGTCSGTACPTVVSGKYDNARSFDGTNDYVSFSSLSPRGDATASFWIRRVGTGNQVMLYMFDGSFTDYLIIGYYSTSDVLLATARNATGWPGSRYSSASAIPQNEWTHIAVVKKEGVIQTIYINGINDTNSASLNWGASGSSNWIGGRNSATPSYLNGSIDDLMIFNRTLTSSEVQQLYMSNLYKFNSSQWYLYVNQSKNATAGLDDGAYTYYTWAKDIGDNVGVSETRTVTIGAGDTTSPTYSNVGINSTIAGESALFSALWNDETALHPNGVYIFSTNNSGSWVNDTAVSFSATPSWANVTKTLTGSAGASVGYRWYANDSAGNWNVTPISTLSTTSAPDIISPTLNFVSPTPANSATTSNSSIIINTSIVEENLKEVKWNWNGTNYTLFNDSLVFMMNFDNRSALGENDTLVVDLSRGGNNGTVTGATWTSSGKYDGAYSFDGTDDYVSFPSISPGGDMTFSFWAKRLGTGNQIMLYMYDGNANDYIIIGYYTTSNVLLASGSSAAGGANSRYSSASAITQNDWVHISVVKNAGDVQKIYINGVDDTNAASVTWTASGSSNRIGMRDTASPLYLNGSIDDLMIFNRTLSSAEVQQIYMSNLQKFNSTQWYLYVNQSKNATAGLDDGTYTYYTWAKDIGDNVGVSETRTVTIGDEDGIAPTISFVSPTPDGDSTQDESYIYVNVSSSDLARGGRNISTFVNFDNSIVSWWRMDDLNATGGVVDYMGINNGTSFGNAAQIENGKIGKAFEFDGDGDYIGTSFYPGTSALGQKFSWTMWKKYSSFAADTGSSGCHGTTPRFYTQIEGTGGQLRAAFGDSFWTATTLGAGRIGEWIFISFVFDEGTVYTYIDGKLNHTQSGVTFTGNNLNAFNIGRGYNNERYMDGAIDDVIIFNRSLSAAEIAGLYANTSTRYLGVNHTGLSAGDYSFKAYSQDSSGNVNFTEERTVTIREASDTTSPTYSSVSHNSTVAGASARFSALWDDETSLHPDGAYIFSTNNSGSWVNDTAVSFGSTPSWANVTKTLTGSAGASVGYRWYANDSAGNWNVTPISTLSTTSAPDIISPTLNFVSPTPANSATTSNSSIIINTSIVEENLKEVKWNWNGTNYTLFNDSLVFMMNFDNRSALGENDTLVVDLSRGGNNGTVTGATWTSSGKYDGAYSFDGTDDYVSFPSISPGGDMTFSFWAKRLGTGNQIMLYMYDGNANDYIIIGYYTTSNVLLASGSSAAGGANSRYSSASAITQNDWVHISVVKNAGDVQKIYINGVDDTNAASVTWTASGSSNRIGMRDTASPLYLNGSIDDLMIFNRTLSSAEVQQIYMSNLQKFNSTQWYLYVNQSKNATAGLDDGTYTYYTWAKDTSNNEAASETRTMTITSSADTTSPTFSNAGHNSTVAGAFNLILCFME